MHLRYTAAQDIIRTESTSCDGWMSDVTSRRQRSCGEWLGGPSHSYARSRTGIHVTGRVTDEVTREGLLSQDYYSQEVEMRNYLGKKVLWISPRSTRLWEHRIKCSRVKEVSPSGGYMMMDDGRWYSADLIQVLEVLDDDDVAVRGVSSGA
jgi:hypothetical protein